MSSSIHILWTKIWEENKLWVLSCWERRESSRRQFHNSLFPYSLPGFLRDKEEERWARASELKVSLSSSEVFFSESYSDQARTLFSIKNEWSDNQLDKLWNIYSSYTKHPLLSISKAMTSDSIFMYNWERRERKFVCWDSANWPFFSYQNSERKNGSETFWLVDSKIQSNWTG